MLLFTTIVLAIFSSLNAQTISSAGCGMRPLFNGLNKIVNGTVAIPGDWAWSVSLTNNLRHFCGGVLINENYVLTAGHCFSTGTFTFSHMVEIGVHNRNSKESWVQQRFISKLWRHEQFNSNTLANDITLIKLDSPVRFDNKYIIPACLDEIEDPTNPDFNLLDPQLKTGWLSGWGHTFYGGALTIEKNQVSMPILADTSCKNRYANMYDIRWNVCAGEVTVGNGACQGDSGGPLVIQSPKDAKWYLVGLISWGYSCGQGTVFARVKNFLSWIRSKIAQG